LGGEEAEAVLVAGAEEGVGLAGAGLAEADAAEVWGAWLGGGEEREDRGGEEVLVC